MKIWNLVAVASVAAVSGIVASAATSHIASADPAWQCAKHNNLTIAHGDLVNARQHLHDAQVANDYDMKGNAANAESSIKAALTSVEAACTVLQGK